MRQSRKGKLGVVLWIYPVAAFVAAAFGSPLICAALLLFVLALERDEWSGRQVTQALGISVVAKVLFALFALIWFIGSGVGMGLLGDILCVMATIFCVILVIGTWGLCILGIVRVVKDKETDIPVFKNFGYAIYGKAAPKPYPKYNPQYNWQQNPWANQPPVNPQQQPPVNPQTPVNPQQPPVNPQAPVNPQQPPANPPQAPVQQNYQAPPAEQNNSDRQN